jgi:glycosyltransferase involved in cell wall biosynthesis
VSAVSVITPAWNAGAYIGETIASVRAQTFTDWELLIVDDGSTDDTVAIVERAEAEDPRIRLLHQSHAGPSAARSLAMFEARGQFFAFLDSDDTWDPRFLEAQLAVFSSYPQTALVTGNGYFFGGPFNGQPVGPPGDASYELPITRIVEDERSIFIMTVFRREVFETIGEFDRSQWRSEDYDFWLRAALAGFVFRKNPQPLGRYRVRGDSLSRDRVRMISGILQTLGKTRHRCPEDDLPLRDVIQRQIRRWERELLLEEAKDALERRDVAAAAGPLRALRASGGGAMVGLTAWLAVHVPPAAMLVYRARLWRPAWLRSGQEA